MFFDHFGHPRCPRAFANIAGRFSGRSPSACRLRVALMSRCRPGSQNLKISICIAPWELFEVGASRWESDEERSERSRREMQNVGRRSVAPRVFGIIIQTTRVSEIIMQTLQRCPKAMRIDRRRPFLKELFFEESVVFEGL